MKHKTKSTNSALALLSRLLFPRTSEIQPLVTFVALVAVFVLNSEIRDSTIGWYMREPFGTLYENGGIMGVLALLFITGIFLLAVYYILKIILQNRKLALDEKYIVMGYHYLILTIVSLGYIAAYIFQASEADEAIQSLSASWGIWDVVSIGVALYLFAIAMLRIFLLRSDNRQRKTDMEKRMAASLDDTQYGVVAISVVAIAVTGLTVLLGAYHGGVILLTLVIMYGQVTAIIVQAVKDLLHPPVSP